MLTAGADEDMLLAGGDDAMLGGPEAMQSGRVCARAWQECKDEPPTIMLGVPHQLMLEEIRLTNHHLQCAVDIIHENNT